MTTSQQHVGNDVEYGARHSDRPERRTYTETKLGIKTTEFYVMLVAVAGILVAAMRNGDDGFSIEEGFRYAAFVAGTYIISRGLAKLGTREPYSDDRS